MNGTFKWSDVDAKKGGINGGKLYGKGNGIAGKWRWEKEIIIKTELD